MLTSLALTAFLMGLTGGPHCLAMCGPACGALAGSGAGKGIGNGVGTGIGIGIGIGTASATGLKHAWVGSALLQFQLGRLLGYSLLGAAAAGSLQGLGWLSVQTAAVRPLWTLFHVFSMLLGLYLLWKAEQPVWLEAPGRKLWAAARSLGQRRGRAVPLLMGLCWVFLPCGLLYSALLVAALSGQAAQGAGVMACFALGSALVLSVGVTAWRRLRGPPQAGLGRSGAPGVRLAGLALACVSAWALWLGYFHNAAPWCRVEAQFTRPALTSATMSQPSTVQDIS